MDNSSTGCSGQHNQRRLHPSRRRASRTRRRRRRLCGGLCARARASAGEHSSVSWCTWVGDLSLVVRT
jgi:hypothetical protein